MGRLRGRDIAAWLRTGEGGAWLSGSFGRVENIVRLGELACLAVRSWGLGRREVGDLVIELAGCGRSVVIVGCIVFLVRKRPRFGALACFAVAIRFQMLAEIGSAGHKLGDSLLWRFGGKVPKEVGVVFWIEAGVAVWTKEARYGRIFGGSLSGFQLLKPASRLVSCGRGAMRDGVGIAVGSTFSFPVGARLAVDWPLRVSLVLSLKLARTRLNSWIGARHRTRPML